MGGCAANGCNGVVTSGGNAVCTGDHFGCPCDPNWSPPPPPTTADPTPTPSPTGPPPLENPWYCVGLFERDDCGFAGCTHEYGLGARNINAGTQWTGYGTGIGHSTKDLCGKNLNGATVICQGDITQTCADYGVALYNSRSCRTYCPSLGDPQFCFTPVFDGYFSFSLSMVLVCDRALP